MHAHGGHGGHGGQGGHGNDHGQGGESTVRDPVCGMTIEKSRAAHFAGHEGETYYFCSDNCFDSFKKNPSQYVGGGDHQHRHHH